MNLLAKVCGLTRPEDVRACLELGFDFVGFIFHPKSRRAVSPEVAAGFPWSRFTRRVGVFVEHSVPEILESMRLARLDLAQLHGGFGPEDCRRIGPERVIKVFWPDRFQDSKAFSRELERFRGLCRYLLFDAGLEGGGHGRAITFPGLGRLTPPEPWILAGGLTPENIPERVAAARPEGVDVSSGVEASPGRKDHARLNRLRRLPELSGHG